MFDVVVGNPPYQNGKHKTFYTGFIKRSFNNLSSGGSMVFICPFNWIENQSGKSSSLFKEMCNDGYFYSIEEVYADELFNIKHGAKLCIFTYTKNPKSNKLGHANIIRVNPLSLIEESILKKVLDKSILPKKGKGQREFSKIKSTEYKYEVYLSHRSDRQVLFANKPYPGYGIDKLIVSWIMETHKVLEHTKIKKFTGVGRYALYFEMPSKNAKNALSFFESNIYMFVNGIKKHGNFTYIFLPNFDFSKKLTNVELYEYFNLSAEEIDYIEERVN